MEPQPFRFLDLPTELRVMVYERLPRRVKNDRIRTGTPPQDYASTITLITKSVCLSILRVNKLVNEEARPVIETIARKYILESPPRIISAASNCSRLTAVEDIFKVITGSLEIALAEGKDAVTRDQIEGLLRQRPLINLAAPPGSNVTACGVHFTRIHSETAGQGVENALYKFVLQAAHQLLYAASRNRPRLAQMVIGTPCIDDLRATLQMIVDLWDINRWHYRHTQVQIGLAGRLAGPRADTKLGVDSVLKWFPQGVTHLWNVRDGEKVCEPIDKESWKEWVEE